MMILPRVLVTRPTEDASTLSRLLQDRGFEVIHEPLLSIHFLNRMVDLSEIQAVLITSSNGARALAMATAIRAVPVFTVGDASAQVCRAHGFTSVITASGDITDLISLIKLDLQPEDGALLHVSGTVTTGNFSEHLMLAGFCTRKVKLYESNTATALLPSTRKMISDGMVKAALFYSPRTAFTFVSLIEKEKEDVGKGLMASRAYCLSKAVKKQLVSLPWESIHVADIPTQESLLALFDYNQAGKQVYHTLTTVQKREKKEDGKVTEHLTFPLDKKEAVKTSEIMIPPVIPVTHMKQVQAVCHRQDRSGNFPHDSENTNSSADSRTTIKKRGINVFFKKTRRIIILLILFTSLPLSIFTAQLWYSYIPESYQSYFPVFLSTSTQLVKLQNSNILLRNEFNQLVSRLTEHQTSGLKLEAQLSSLKADVIKLQQGVIQQQKPPTNPLYPVIDSSSPTNLSNEEPGRSTSHVHDNLFLEQLDKRLSNVEATVYHLSAKKSTVLPWLLAIIQLRDAVYHGTSFLVELQAVRSLSDSHAMVDEMTAGFSAYATTGLPTLQAIESSFNKISSDITYISEFSRDDSWAKYLLGRLLTVVKIRHIGDMNDEDIPGILGRASLAIHLGDLADAIQEVEVLHDGGELSNIIEPWLTHARARVSADVALSNLATQALERVAEQNMQKPGHTTLMQDQNSQLGSEIDD